MNSTRLLLAGLFCLAAKGFAGEVQAEDPPPEAKGPVVLGSGVIARLDTFDVPADWFTHEFRSAFFRHAGATNMREAVWTPFLERMTLYALARREGLHEQPALRARIAERISDLRAFMEYQLAMTEVGMVVEAFLASRGMKPDDVTAGDDDLREFFETRIKGQPGAPDRFEDIPAALRPQLRQNVALELFSRRVSEALVEWKTNVSVTVNRGLIEAVPLPAMQGSPAGFSP